MRYLHIFAQEQWHDPACIIGNMVGLAALRDAIDNAIKTGSGFSTTFTGDGEGFNTLIGLVDDTAFDTLAVPYEYEFAREKRENAVWPDSVPTILCAQQAALKERERKYPKELP